MKNLAIIPARGGSKSIPMKNVYPINGKPLIEYSIESALESKVFDKIIVSSDHEQILRVSAQYPEVIALKRPAEISGDESSTESVLLDVCEELYRQNAYSPDVVYTLEPTSPLRSVKTIRNCSEMFQDERIDSVIGVVESRSCYGSLVDGRFEHLFPNQPRRRQEREPLFRESSTIYATRRAVLQRKKSVLGDNLVPLLIEELEAIDLNEPSDLILLQAIIKYRDDVAFSGDL